MTDLRAAAQQALEALENHTAIKHPQQRHYRDEAIDALRVALAEPQTTHSAECYKRHPDCAAAEVERLKSLCEEMLSELYTYRASKYLRDVTAAIRARGNT